MSELPALPDCTFLALRHEGWRLHVTLNRPKVRNAMNFAMVREMIALFEALEDRRDIRAVILRGAGGHFCAGGDIKDMASVRHAEFDASQGEPDPMAVTMAAPSAPVAGRAGSGRNIA